MNNLGWPAPSMPRRSIRETLKRPWLTDNSPDSTRATPLLFRGKNSLGNAVDATRSGVQKANRIFLRLRPRDRGKSEVGRRESRQNAAVPLRRAEAYDSSSSFSPNRASQRPRAGRLGGLVGASA